MKERLTFSCCNLGRRCRSISAMLKARTGSDRPHDPIATASTASTVCLIGLYRSSVLGLSDWSDWRAFLHWTNSDMDHASMVRIDCCRLGQFALDFSRNSGRCILSAKSTEANPDRLHQIHWWLWYIIYIYIYMLSIVTIVMCCDRQVERR